MSTVYILLLTIIPFKLVLYIVIEVNILIITVYYTIQCRKLYAGHCTKSILPLEGTFSPITTYSGSAAVSSSMSLTVPTFVALSSLNSLSSF